MNEPALLGDARNWAATALRGRRFDIDPPRAMWQISLISALLAGVYDGDTTVAEVLQHGDFGLGTFNHLDGEMVILDGLAYQMRSDGTVTEAAGTDRTPFAAVVPFKEDIAIGIDKLTRRSEMVAAFERGLSTNLMYALRIDGEFENVTTRTVEGQHKPYPRFTDVAAKEQTRSTGAVEGTLVGFRLPAFEAGISVPGYHLHFVSDDRRRGGHVLDFAVSRGTVSAMVVDDLQVQIPTDPTFLNANLAADDLEAEIRTTEGS